MPCPPLVRFCVVTSSIIESHLSHYQFCLCLIFSLIPEPETSSFGIAVKVRSLLLNVLFSVSITPSLKTVLHASIVEILKDDNPATTTLPPPSTTTTTNGTSPSTPTTTVTVSSFMIYKYSTLLLNHFSPPCIIAIRPGHN